MATTAELTARIERKLASVIDTLAYLPETFDEWESMTEANQVSTSLDWDHLMASNLTELDEHYQAGRMTPAQAGRYRQLLVDLEAILPRLEAMRFYLPPVSLDISTA